VIKMLIHVKLYATLHRLAPKGSALGESFEVEMNGTAVSDLLQYLQVEEKQAKIVMVNGQRVTDLTHTLSPEDLVVIFPPVGGG
jgi:molybdopterin converting factor small subunit